LAGEVEQTRLTASIPFADDLHVFFEFETRFAFDQVSAGGEEHDFAGRRGFDRALDRRGVIRFAVALAPYAASFTLIAMFGPPVSTVFSASSASF
jgi:hypothetical protein